MLFRSVSQSRYRHTALLLSHSHSHTLLRPYPHLLLSLRHTLPLYFTFHHHHFRRLPYHSVLLLKTSPHWSLLLRKHRSTRIQLAQQEQLGVIPSRVRSDRRQGFYPLGVVVDVSSLNPLPFVGLPLLLPALRPQLSLPASPAQHLTAHLHPKEA